MRGRLVQLRRRAFLARSRRRVGAERFGRLGRGSGFEQPATILSPHRVFIGEDTFFHRDAFLSVVEHHRGRDHEPRLTVGDRCAFMRGVWISCVGEITIGDEVFVAERCVIADSHHEYEDPDTSLARQPMAPPQAVVIEDGVFINPGAVVTAGVRIGARSFVGPNAVVTADVPPNSVVVGNPGRIIRHFDRERGEWVDG